MKIKKIAIVGGGTAGWLAANYLGLSVGRDPEVEICLIESKDVPTIGVGEGTVPNIRATLQRFGIDEREFMAKCQATFKLGIKFANWMDADKYGADHYYYHPFVAPFPVGVDISHYWMHHQQQMAFSELSAMHALAEHNIGPKHPSSSPYDGVVHYAYHFDAGKFAQLLADNALTRFGVRHKFATIEHVVMGDDGSIDRLQFASGGEEAFDFYIDCSGFASRLLGQALQVPFLAKTEQIPTDTALAVQVPTEPSDEVQPYTTAKAHSAGWIWDIPLPHRRGTGFVYSSSHMSESQAVAEFSRYLGFDAEAANLRKVPMQAGYRQYFWHKNCAALGLSQGFVEPLEATSIMVTDFCAALLADHFPRDTDDIALLSRHCNDWVEYIWERTIDFIQLHYCISDRRDSDFWVDCTDRAKLSDVLAERLALWKIASPKRTDFFSTVDLFNQQSYMYVLYGMYFPTRLPALNPSEIPLAEAKIREHNAWCEKAVQALSSHRAWLNQLHSR
ncbi:tryptophan halogenase family protein [Gilvimarinus sp. DA14]|uniref:tryptophan halogenase family protein n=1 Tax=Gilvimarinus sp. DA14 TaxID=2956798 RepID=UPI0020B70A36|nr:tryptophan halogenase family protein [Gilvimarinus sp. DA14]UTF61459.1 tryptophan 7-halogenase [Gilvimarinus sp. DA14]